MKINLILATLLFVINFYSSAQADEIKRASEVQNEFKKAAELEKESMAHLAKAKLLEKQKSIISDQNAYIRLNRRDAEKNYNNDFFNFINDWRTLLKEKIEYRDKKKKKTLNSKELQKVLNKLYNSYGASLEISEIFTIEKAALNGKFDKKDPTIKDDFWLAEQSWSRCKEINKELDESFSKMFRDERIGMEEKLNKEADNLLSVISVSYTVGLTKIRDARN